MNNSEIDAFARLLDGDLPEGEATAEARVLSVFARALESSAATPRMDSKAELRMALVEAARQQAAAPSLLARMRQGVDDTTARWRYSMRMAAASGAAAMALSSGGMALAAHRSMPSDLFYGVKLAYEDVRVSLIGDPVARAEQLFAYASQRMFEAELSAGEGDMDGARRALIQADESARSAAGYLIGASQDRNDPSLLTMLDDFAREQRRRLTALLPLLSGDAVLAAEDALVGMRRIHQRVAVLSGPCTECDAQPAAGGRGAGRDDDQAAAAAANPDFDFADIPHASEPFAPCPCTGATTVEEPAGKAKKKARDKAGAATSGGATAGGGQTTPPGSGGAGESAGGDDGGDDGGNDGEGDSPLPKLPDPVDEPVKDAEDVITDVLDNPPTNPPTLPPLPVPVPDVPDLP